MIPILYEAMDVGDLVEIYANFTAGDPPAYADPTTVRLSIKLPDGTIEEHVYGDAIGLDRTGIGQYKYDFEIQQSGKWYYHWEGDGAVATSSETFIRVHRSAFEPSAALTATQELRLRIGERIPSGGDDTDTMFTDSEIAAIMAAAGEDVTLAAAIGWEIKAGTLARLVDISESGTDRALSQRFKHAEAMMKFYASTYEARQKALQAGFRTVGKVACLDSTRNGEELETPFSGYSEHVYARTYLLKRFPHIMSGSGATWVPS